MTAGPTRCRRCTALIRWARTSSGKLMPLDSEPDSGGNVWLFSGKYDGRGNQRVAHVGPDPTPPLDLDPTAVGPYMPHFATCPYPDGPPPSRTGGRRLGADPSEDVWI